MILTCSECASRYFVDEARIGPNGRKVRCAACGHAWVEPPPAAAEGAPQILQLEPDPMAEPGSFSAAVDAASLSPELQRPRLRDDVSAKLREAAADKRKTREAVAVGVVWGVLGVSFCVLMLGAIVFKTDVVRLVPQTAGAYAFMRMPVNPTGLGFSLSGAMGLENGRAALIVTGTMRNEETSARPLIPLRIVVFDNSGKRLAAQVVSMSAGALAPGETRPIRTVFYDPPLQASEIQAEFAFDKIKQPVATPVKLAPPPAVEPPSAALKLRGVGGAVGAAVPPPAPPVEPEAARPLPSSSPYALPAAAADHV